MYQLLEKNGVVKYYGITARDPVRRKPEHVRSGILQPGERMQVIGKGLNHDQARTAEARLLRARIAEYYYSPYFSVRVQLEQAGLRNKNGGRDIDKRPFDARTMGRENSLLDTPKDVNSDYTIIPQHNFL